MHRRDLLRAIARTTGDTISTIKRLGFQVEDHLYSANEGIDLSAEGNSIESSSSRTGLLNKLQQTPSNVTVNLCCSVSSTEC